MFNTKQVISQDELVELIEYNLNAWTDEEIELNASDFAKRGDTDDPVARFDAAQTDLVAAITMLERPTLKPVTLKPEVSLILRRMLSHSPILTLRDNIQKPCIDENKLVAMKADALVNRMKDDKDYIDTRWILSLVACLK